MKKTLTLSFISLLTFGMVGCEDMSQNTQRGALGGAVVGGVIGHQSGHAIEGAAIGATVGGLGGAAYDKSKEDSN